MTDAAERLYDQLLVVRAQTGDDAAFGQLVDRYHPRLRYFVSRLLGDADLTNDVLQNVWLTAYQKLPRMRQPAALSVWLYRIARNKALAELRRQGRWSTLSKEQHDTCAPAAELEFTSQEAAEIHACLERLCPEHREALSLRFLGDLSYQEIARVIGCPIGTVRSRLHHAKRALRRELGGD